MADALKEMYSRVFFEGMAAKVAEAYPPFDVEAFLGRVFAPDWESLALKQRMRRGAEALRPGLPAAYEDALDVVLDAAERCGSGFPYMMFPDFVEVYGLDDPERSIPALARLTKYSSSEFAVRPYLVKYRERTLAAMREWAKSDDEHVRRLASEGCRPRLPWGMALAAFKRDPSPIVPILEALKRDPSEYVRRSVANNLNDVSKDHPALALDIARSWLGEHPHTDWIAKHACRTLLKKCVPEALALFGVGDAGGVRVERFETSTGVAAGGVFEASFVLSVDGPAPRKLRVEYAIDYVKANGSRSRKLFKLSEREFPPGETSMSFRQSFRDMTTRKHYPGEHVAAIVANGSELASKIFQVNL
ncbi:DNA alkylation repair protein [Paenibacillus antri]|uniref:DNA alkylation repair protein n=1 Tax=Paenibacillus antri TaxID=2582848 RepID=A0A5R9GG85_9BACL|nr:DNA alkylation repair protein [Paenibacillus antri]TLS54209.1 DNA alkylation repair protein [Paenibacillus antri]